MRVRRRRIVLSLSRQRIKGRRFFTHNDLSMIVAIRGQLCACVGGYTISFISAYVLLPELRLAGQWTLARTIISGRAWNG